MLGVAALADRLGISVDQVRYLLDQLGPVLDPFQRRGNKNKILVSQAGLPVLERAIQLKKDGLALESIRDLISEELQSKSQSETNTESQHATEPSQTEMPNDSQILQSDSEPFLSNILIEELRNRIRDKDQQIRDLKEEKEKAYEDRDRLFAMLENRDDQIKALMPGKPEIAESPESDEPKEQSGNNKPSRLRALTYALFGK